MWVHTRAALHLHRPRVLTPCCPCARALTPKQEFLPRCAGRHLPVCHAAVPGGNPVDAVGLQGPRSGGAGRPTQGPNVRARGICAWPHALHGRGPRQERCRHQACRRVSCVYRTGSDSAAASTTIGCNNDAIYSTRAHALSPPPPAHCAAAPGAQTPAREAQSKGAPLTAKGLTIGNASPLAPPLMAQSPTKSNA
jgi:hypothetical protein